MGTNRPLYLDQVQALAHRAIAAGGRITSHGTVAWDVSGNCEAPVSRTVMARPSRDQFSPMIDVSPGKTATPVWVDLELRCRKCDRCRNLRRRLWSSRARAETAAAVRTWFGTLTLNPEHQTKVLNLARKREMLQGIDFDALDYGEQFLCLHRQVNVEITKYLKRVRKAVKGPLRYLFVAESHKSGMPHYHALIHEMRPEFPVRHKLLTDQWHLGFTNFKLVEETTPMTMDGPNAATYLCKYLAKSTVARVRASVRYGNDVLERSFFNPLKNVVAQPLTPSSPVTLQPKDGLTHHELLEQHWGKEVDC